MPVSLDRSIHYCKMVEEERHSCYICHREHEQLGLTVMDIGCYSNHETEEEGHNYYNLDIHYEQMVQESQRNDYSDQKHW